jgi:ATP-dependent Clp protease ATP-binding subunit ClpA
MESIRYGVGLDVDALRAAVRFRTLTPAGKMKTGSQLTDVIRKHLRPELVNQLTKIVHFNTLGMDAAREIVGKLLTQLNARISDRGVTVELDESAVELILREGYSKEYGRGIWSG